MVSGVITFCEKAESVKRVNVKERSVFIFIEIDGKEVNVTASQFNGNSRMMHEAEGLVLDKIYLIFLCKE
jgi:hypothetical protein